MELCCYMGYGMFLLHKRLFYVFLVLLLNFVNYIIKCNRNAKKSSVIWDELTKEA